MVLPQECSERALISVEIEADFASRSEICTIMATARVNTLPSLRLCLPLRSVRRLGQRAMLSAPREVDERSGACTSCASISLSLVCLPAEVFERHSHFLSISLQMQPQVTFAGMSIVYGEG